MAKVISQLPSGGSTPSHNNLQGLNEGDYIHLTQLEKDKLDGIQPGAEVNVNADWNAISGDAQILNKPTTFLPSAHTHIISDVTGLQFELNEKENIVNKSTTVSLGTSNILFPTQNAVKTYVDTQISTVSIVDATTVVKGKIKLSGDLGGTADLPTVPDLNNKLNKDFSPLTTATLPLIGTELIVINQEGIEKKLSISEIKNGSLFLSELFIYAGGAQEFITVNNIAQTLLVFRNGKQIDEFISTSTKITITTQLNVDDEIFILYASVPVGINPFYTKVEVDTELNLKANLNGTQTFTGIHNFPTALEGTNNNQVANTFFVQKAIESSDFLLYSYSF